MILSILIIKLKVSGDQFLQHPLSKSQLIQVPGSGRTLPVAAFVNGNILLLFPVIKGIMAMWAEQLRTGFCFRPVAFMNFERVFTDLTYQL